MRWLCKRERELPFSEVWLALNVVVVLNDTSYMCLCTHTNVRAFTHLPKRAQTHLNTLLVRASLIMYICNIHSLYLNLFFVCVGRIHL